MYGIKRIRNIRINPYASQKLGNVIPVNKDVIKLRIRIPLHRNLFIKL